ncbi:MAG: hypothetical protein L0H64_12340 [Pseudonocardia sp.]|nr:hypothetical protein [Pseudonocardia sp.]
MRVRDAVAVTVATAALALVAPVTAQAATSCQPVLVRGTGQAVGPTSTTAVLRGPGLLGGATTAASFTITGQPTPRTVTFAGTIEIDTRRGTLTSPVTGVLDTVKGGFVTRTTGLTGGDGLDGASGTLVLAGVQDLVDGSFTEVVTGRICTP